MPSVHANIVPRVAKTPKGLRAAIEVVPRLGPKPGIPALRVAGVSTYDRPIEHVAGQLDDIPLCLPLEAKAARYGLVLCFALEETDLAGLGAELVRVAHPDGAVWVVVWKKDRLPAAAPSWDQAQEAILGAGWVDNKILSLGEDVYATRYVRRRKPGRREPTAPVRRS